MKVKWESEQHVNVSGIGSFQPGEEKDVSIEQGQNLLDLKILGGRFVTASAVPRSRGKSLSQE